MNNELFNVISNFRSFDWTRDLLDVIIITIAFYELILFARKSRAGQLVKGLMLLLAFYALAYYFRLRTVRWVLSNVMQIGFIAAVVLFQPELRRTLERLGQSTSWASKIFYPENGTDPAQPMAKCHCCNLRCGGAAFRYPYRRTDGTGTEE